MKKTLIQKTVCVLLAVIMTLGLTVGAAAAIEEKPVPVVIVSGMASYPLIDEDTGESAWPISEERMQRDIIKLIGPAAASLGMSDWEILEKYGTKPIHDLFEPMRCTENGDSVYNIKPVLHPESAGNYPEDFGYPSTVAAVAEKTGWDRTYFFYYDWRMSPMDIADELDETIDRVLEETNSDKVSLLALSMGGTITSAYLYKYGTDCLKNVVYGSTAFLGTEIVGQLFIEKPDITVASALDYANSFMAADGDFLKLVFGAADGVYSAFGKGMIDEFISGMISALQIPVYEKIFMDTFICFPGIWALVPSKYYAEAKEKMSKYVSLTDEFIAKSDEYIYNVQSKVPELFAKAKANGVEVYVVGGYGFSSIPVTGAATQTDNLIDTYLMTGNCAVAPFGKTLSDIEYSHEGACEDPAHNHVSTDGIIDASVSILPEKTWVVKNMKHVEFLADNDTGALISWLVNSREPVDVYTDARFPQFVELNRATGRFSSLTQGVTVPGGGDPAEKSPVVVLVELLKKIIDFVLKIVGKAV